MVLFWIVVWGVIAFGSSVLSLEVMIPHMKRKKRDDTDTSESSNFENVTGYTTITGSISIKAAVIITCVLYMAVCGYFASGNAIDNISMIKLLLTMAVLLVVAITDLELMLIPNICSLTLIAGRIILVIVEYVAVPETAFIRFGNSCISLILTFVCLFVTNRLTKGGLGMGDVKLLSSLGFLCGVQASFITLILSFLACIPVCLYLLIFKKKQMSLKLPLGPFIWLGYGAAIILAIL